MDTSPGWTCCWTCPGTQESLVSATSLLCSHVGRDRCLKTDWMEGGGGRVYDFCLRETDVVNHRPRWGGGGNSSVCLLIVKRQKKKKMEIIVHQLPLGAPGVNCEWRVGVGVGGGLGGGSSFHIHPCFIISSLPPPVAQTVPRGARRQKHL